MRSGIRGKLLLLIALLSLALIVSSVLISSRLYRDSLERNERELCAETADTLVGSITDAHWDFIRDVRSKIGAIYGENRELLEQAAVTEFESYDKRAAFYEALTADIFPPKQGFGMSYEMLAFKLEYEALANEMDMLSFAGGLDAASLFFYDGEHGNLVYLIDRMPESSMRYSFPASVSKPQDEILAGALESGSAVSYVKDGSCMALAPVTGTGDVFVRFGKRSMDLSRSVRLFSLYTLGILLGATLIIGVFTLFFADRLIVRNVKKLTAASRRFSSEIHGGSPEQVSAEIRSGDEIGELSEAFDLMQGAILGYLSSLAEKTAQEEKMKAELELAASIQLEALPKAQLQQGAAVLRSFLKPAREVGGDLYEYFPLDEDRIFFCLADVSGKGVPASLFMMRAMELIKAEVHSASSLDEFAFRLNNQLCAGNEESIFITAFFGVLDVRDGQLSYLRAGHEQPLLRRGDEVIRLSEESNSILGVFEDMEFRAETLRLEPEDLMLMFTDGLSEGINEAQEAFGCQRIAEALRQAGEDPTRTLYRALCEFCGDAEQFDDVTMLALSFGKTKRLELTAPSYSDIPGVTDALLGELEGFDPEQLSELGVILDEILNNQISYAFPRTGEPRIWLSLALREGEAELCFEDNGLPFDPLTGPAEAVPAETEGGFGIQLVRSLSDSQRYTRRGDRNRLTVTKRLRPVGAEGNR